MASRIKEWILLAVWSVLLFSSVLWLDTQHNRFSYRYHPDEPGKAEQVIQQRWNFNHPMLLLSTASLLSRAAISDGDEQAVVERGRLVSALFCAAAVVALSLLGFLWQGWLGALAGGAGLGLHHQLFELAHYMKEDTALLFGLAFVFVAAMAYSQSPSRWRAVVLGAACGFAISGKYIGVCALAVAVPVLWVCPTGLRKVRCGLFAAALGTVFLIVNFPMFAHLSTFFHSFGREVELVREGQGDVTRSIPHALYWNVFLDNTTPAIWLLLACFISQCWRRWRSLNLAQQILAFFPFVYALALSFSPKENDRYFLPATALFTLFAALGILEVPRLVSSLCRFFALANPERFMEGRLRNLVVGIAAAIFLTLQITGTSSGKPGLLEYDEAFQNDDMADLIAYMNTKLPPTAHVAADGKVGLPDLSRKKNAALVKPVPQELAIKKLASDLGTLNELRAKGFTHVAISESSYGRFFRNDLRPKDGKREGFDKAKAFYQELLRDRSSLLFERDRGTVIYLHPGIRVYALAE